MKLKMIMISQRFPIAPLLSIMAFLIPNAQAELSTQENMLDMSLEELSKVKVTVASFHEETLDWSSAMVTRYDREDMEALGVRSIPELLSLVPGVVMQVGQRGNEQVMVRGIVDTWNQKVLFLINDTPYWMPSHGEIPMRGIPFIAIDHVEIIRGPGAVVHGSNATAAVVKIVTREQQSAEASLAAGQESMSDYSAYLGGKVGNEPEGLRYSLSAQRWDDGDRSAEISGALARPKDGEIELDRDGKSALFQIAYADVSLMLQHFETTYSGIDGFSAASNLSKMHYDGSLAQVAWKKQWHNFSLELHTEYNEFYLQSDIDNISSPIGIDAGAGTIDFDNDGDENYRWRSGGKGSYQSEQHLITLGYDYEERSADSLRSYVPGIFSDTAFSTLIRQDRSFENTVYLQDDWSLGDWRLVTGLRHVDIDEYESETLPRVTLMYRIDPQRTVRALYGVGFNSPSFAQMGNELTFIILPIQDDIQPEKIKTSELAYHEQHQNWLWGANLYYFETEDFINPVLNIDTTIFNNVEDFHRYGLEAEAEWQHDAFKLFGNLAYQRQGNERIEDDPSAILVPKITAVIGGQYQLNQHTIGLSWRHYMKREQASEINDININYSYLLKHWQLSITAKNVLDDNTISLDSRSRAVIEQDDGRQVIAEIRYRYH